MISPSASAILQSRAAAATANRAAMPTVSAWFDATRATFPDARLKWAEENGLTLGVRRQWTEVSAAQMCLSKPQALLQPPAKRK